jgi:putative ABC transport system permease protein
MRLEHWLNTVPLRLRSLFRRQCVEQELDDELRYHLEETMRSSTEAGSHAAQARREALREIGGLEQAKERCRDARRVRLVETTVQDIRYGARGLRKNPGFSAVVVLTLALGLGANTAIFSLVNGILLVPLPYRSPERLVSITGTYPKGALVAMREQMRTMTVAGYSDGHEVNLTGHGEPVRLTAAFVSADLFSVLGAAADLGRTFATGEDSVGRDGYVILSDNVWKRRFGKDAGIIGRVIELDGMPREVIGVMPAAFRFPSTATDLWVPLRNDPRSLVGYWAGDFMPAVGRLVPDASIQAARADIQLFQSQVLKKFPWPMPASWNQNVSVELLQHDMVEGARLRLLMLLGAVALVLLIACANVANLTLARASGRSREIAVRSALGAGRWRIVRQLLTESVLLASVGGGLGILLAREGLRLLQSTLPADTPRLSEVHIDLRVLAFTATLAILTGVAFGLVPALQGSRAALADPLKSGRGTDVPVSSRLRGALVITEVAIAVWLVIGATLLIRSVWTLAHVSPGFSADHVVTTRLTPNASFCVEPERCVAFYRDVLTEIQRTPGIEAAALVNTLPLDGRVTKRSVGIEGRMGAPTQAAPLLWLHTVTPDYFRAMGITLLAGRLFTDEDASGKSLVAMVDESTARRYWPDTSPIGKRIRFVSSPDWHVIVGVVPDLRAYSLQERVPSWIAGTLYVPYNSRATTEDGRIPAAMTLAVRTSVDEARLAAALSRIVANVNRDVPVSDVRTMQAVVSESVSTPASTATLFSAFAALALVLGMIGIYGVLSFLVSKRTQEIGLRLALGAQRRDVLWLIAKDAVRLSGAGIMLGLAGAFGLTRLLARELYGVSPLDPATYAGVALAVTLVAIVACGIPAIRGLRVDPLVALRQD